MNKMMSSVRCVNVPHELRFKSLLMALPVCRSQETLSNPYISGRKNIYFDLSNAMSAEFRHPSLFPCFDVTLKFGNSVLLLPSFVLCSFALVTSCRTETAVHRNMFREDHTFWAKRSFVANATCAPCVVRPPLWILDLMVFYGQAG